MIKMSINNKTKNKSNKNNKSIKNNSSNKNSNKQRLKPIKPTRKEINRYVMFQIIKGTNQEEKILSKTINMNIIKKEDNKEFFKKLKSTYINLFGVFDYAKAGVTSIGMSEIQLKIFNKNPLEKKLEIQNKKVKGFDSDIGIIKIRNDKLDELRTCFLFMDFLGEEQTIIRTLKTSGTIKALVEKSKKE